MSIDPKPEGVKKKLRKQNCVYCNSLCKGTIDHIIPKSRGGVNEADNYQTLCSFCNNKKGNKTEVELRAIFLDIKKRGVWYEWEHFYKNWLDWLIIVRKERKAKPHYLFTNIE